MMLGTNRSFEDESMTVMTFNIRYGSANDGENSWSNRKEMVFETIRKNHPDVLGLQEALDFQIQEIIAACPEYRWVGVGRDDGISKGEFSPILYRIDRIGVLDYGTRWISDTPLVVGSKGPGANLPRIFSWAKIRLKSGREGMFINTHFDHQSEDARQLGSKQIVEKVESESLPFSIVVGDLNSGYESPSVLTFRHSGFLTARPEKGPFGTFTGFVFDKVDGEQIDHIFVRGSASFQSVLIDSWSKANRYPSDHFPIVAELKITD